MSVCECVCERERGCVCVSVCVCVCLCLCACHQVCGQMAEFINTALSEAITFDNISTLQHYQDILLPFPLHMGHPHKITFWAIISKRTHTKPEKHIA